MIYLPYTFSRGIEATLEVLTSFPNIKPLYSLEGVGVYSTMNNSKILITPKSKDYELIDSGEGEKLERFL